MFNFFKETRDILSLKEELEDTQRLLQQAEDKLEKILHRSMNCEIGFDFNVVKVFSIERNYEEDIPHTIVGYVLPEPSESDRVREWFLYCSDEQHEKLVEEFRKFQQK